MKSLLIGFKNTTFKESNSLVEQAILDHFESGRRLIDLVANSCFCCTKKLLHDNNSLDSHDALEIYFDSIKYLLGQKYDPFLGKNNFVGSLDNKMKKMFIDKMRKKNKIENREGSGIGVEELNFESKCSNLSEEEEYLERKRMENFENSLDSSQVDLDLGV